MNVELKKFGSTLISRQTGREAFSAFQSTLEEVNETENIVINFEGVITFSPSWGDEFLTPLLKRFGDRLILNNTQNSSVLATLKTLEEIGSQKFNISD
jgi:hypothetical protein